jgi:hypothetical protein
MIQLYQELKKSHSAWLDGSSPSALVDASQRFIDFLSEMFLVSQKSLSLANRPRPHNCDSKGRLSNELHGLCEFDGNIRIYLRTSARAQPVAFKTFFNTLLHEWVHHYDHEALGDTIHCAGFYQRIRSVYQCCLASED